MSGYFLPIIKESNVMKAIPPIAGNVVNGENKPVESGIKCVSENLDGMGYKSCEI